MKNMKNNVAFVTIVILLLSVSCSSVKEGIVIKKWYEPMTSSIILMPVVTMVGKTSVTTMIPMTVIDGEDFCIKIEGLNKNGEIKQRTLYLDPFTYEKIQIGDFYIVNPEDEKDRTYSEERK